MMIDYLTEQLLPLSSLAREVPSRNGRGINVVTLWRWATKPNRFGLRLESVCVGGTRMSSREALQRYLAATTAAADGTSVPANNPRRESAIEAAEREMASL